MKKGRVGVIIEARYYASRLYGKVMKEAIGKPIIQLLIERIKPSKSADEIVIATTLKPDSDIIEDFCKKNNVKYFRGSEDDVLDRVLQTAKTYNVDIIVELTADSPLVDAELIDNIIKFYYENDYDYVSTFNTRTFPVGYDVRIFSTKILDDVNKITQDPSDRENVSTYIFNHPEKYKIGSFIAPKEINHPEYRLVLDYQEDYDLLKNIFEHFKSPIFSIKQVVDYLKSNPEIASINKEKTHKEFRMYKAAIVGLGRMGQLFENDPLMKKPCAHADAYAYLKDKVQLTAGCDIRNDRLKLFGEKYNINRLYTDYKEMLKKEEIDILSIATHAPEHKEITLEAVKSGVKVIFCEKPISTNLKDAEEMVKVCKENNVILYVNHTRRFDNVWRKAKELVENGIIGSIKIINAYSTAGLLNGGSHLFDLLRFYNGDVESVNAELKKDNSTDASGTGFLKFKNGTYAFVDIDYRDYVLFQINLIGTKGIIKCGGMIRGDKTFELLTAKSSPTQTGLLELEREDFPEVKGEMPLVNAINEIIDVLENKKQNLTSSGEDGLKALEICMAFHESDKLIKEVKLPLENKNYVVIPRCTSFTEDGKFPESYEKNNILPGF